VQAHSEGEALGKVLKTSLDFGFIEAQKALMDELFEGKAPVLKNEKCRHSTRRNQNKHRARKAQNTGTSDTGADKQVTEKEGQGRGWGENWPGHQA